MPTTINQRVLEQSISSCLNEADESDYPIPYLPSVLFGNDAGRAWIVNAVNQNQYNRALGTEAETYEVAKFHQGKTRTLHSIPIAERVEYHSLARHLGVRDGRLQNDVSFSFKPNLSPTSEIWNEPTSHQRWINYQEALHRQCLSQQFFQRADIENFFNRIRHDKVHNAVIARYEDSFCQDLNSLHVLADRLIQLLNGWSAGSRMGIPQGYSASFFFAELPLLEVDYAFDKHDYSVYRFVDDYCIFGATEAPVARQFEQIEAMLFDLGLTFNIAKNEFGTCNILSERLSYFQNTRQQFKRATEKLRSGPNKQKIDVAVELLRKELYGFDINRYCVSYLLTIIRNNIKSVGRISDEMLQSFSDCFKDHSICAANALHAWLPIFNGNINEPGIQELLSDLLTNERSMLDTDVAFCYGSFTLARRIQNTNVKKSLVDRFEHDAATYIPKWSGSVAARKGKALRAAQRHGSGNNMLMDLFRKNNYYHEMRRYTAVAATNLPEEQRSEFFRSQIQTCICPEERYVIEQLEQQDEIDATNGSCSLVAYPDARKKPPKKYGPIV